MGATHAHLLVARSAVACERCTARIVFARVDGGRLIPVDVEPDPDGNVAIRVDSTGRIRARVLSEDRPAPEGTERLHVPHFATCGPAAAQARRGDGVIPAYRIRALQQRAVPPDQPDALW